jgi:hypothetical protein
MAVDQSQIKRVQLLRTIARRNALRETEMTRLTEYLPTGLILGYTCWEVDQTFPAAERYG